MKRTIILFTSLLILFSLYSASGQQQFRFKYKLKTSFNRHGQLYEVATDETNKVPSLVGFIDASKILKSDTMKDKTVPIYNLIPKVDYTKRNIRLDLSCTVKVNETKDTITLNPWYSQDGDKRLEDESKNPVAINDDNEYIFKIENWDYTKIGKHPYIDIPFRFRQLTATNVPLRVNLKNGEVQADFLSINVAYFWLYGKTRIYQSKHVDARNFYGGFGLFVGGGAIEEDTKKLFGLNYGISGMLSIYNINLVLALGGESGFNTTINKFNPYIGLGLGVKLIDLFEPSTKQE